MRLVRELLAADGGPEIAQADAAGRAHRYLEVVSRGLGLRAGAVLLRIAADGSLACVASTLPERVRTLLGERTGRTMALLRKASEERRAFLMRGTSDDPLLQAFREADPAIEAVAIVPLADRGPVGALLLAASEAALAAETIRTLNPALRLLALLVSPLRDGAPADPALRGERDAARAESEKRAFEIAQLRARVEELEARLASAPRVERTTEEVAAAAATTARKVGDLVAAASGAEGEEPVAGAPHIVVVVDTSKVWESYAVRDHTVVVVSPSSDLAGQVRALAPARVVVNLAVPGALESLAALHDGPRTLSVWGVVADTTNERVLGLGTIDAVGRPPTAEALVAAVDRQAPRGARVFAAGRDADALMKMRQVLAKQGFSVSMARDTKQIAELLDMVKPQLVIVDLQLPMREGYELVMRVTSLSPIPSLIVIPPDGDPAPTLADKLRDRLASGQGMGAKQWLSDLLTRKIAAVEHRPKSTSVAAHPH